ncbi:MAG TPA: hypothetical protein VHD14_14825 [Pseudolabrys sp.]|nr:hypothetical protein [Pseudolabrys sp.]
MMFEKIGGSIAVARAALLICAVAFAAAPAAAELVNENLLVAVPDGYKVDFSEKSAKMMMQEMVPAAENVHGWTEMVTVQIFYNFKVPLDTFRAGNEKLWGEACPHSIFNDVASVTENGYPALIWLQTCPLNSETGKPEITFFKAIQGKDSLYLVQKAFKFQPSKQQIVTWVQYLKKVSVCDSRLPERRCPATKD